MSQNNAISLPDITSREDVELLIDSFYKKVVVDDVIGYVFTEVIALNWSTHIPIMNDFWCSILLGERKYNGHPMQKHVALSKQTKLEQKHFDRWLMLWNQTIEENFAGANANEAVKRAQLMGSLMMHKISESESSRFIQ